MARFDIGDAAIFRNSEVIIQEILPFASWKDEPPQVSYVVFFSNFYNGNSANKEERFVVEEDQLSAVDRNSQCKASSFVVNAELALPPARLIYEGVFVEHFLTKHPVVIYVLTTFYSEFRELQHKYEDLAYPFLYVYDPYTLLQVKPEPRFIVNLFSTINVPNAGERLWSNGIWTFNEAEKHIGDILTRISKDGAVIYHDMESLVRNLGAWDGALK